MICQVENSLLLPPTLCTRINIYLVLVLRQIFVTFFMVDIVAVSYQFVFDPSNFVMFIGQIEFKSYSLNLLALMSFFYRARVRNKL